MFGVKRWQKMSENTKTINKTIEAQPTSNEKLPYVKPELHLFDLEGTEGKIPTPGESSLTTSLKFGPS